MILSDIGPVALVGAGKMGLALAKGWIAGGLPPDRLVLCDPKPAEPTLRFADQKGVTVLDSPLGVLTHVLVLAVKPQAINGVMMEIQPVVGPHTLVLSIAAGIPLKRLSEALSTRRVIRTMPNTPAQLGKGVTGAVGLDITEPDRAVADALLRTAGDVLWFSDEAALDAVTAVSGSGPAYVFHMVEALAAAAIEQGLGPAEAMRLARGTIIGAAALLESESAPPAELRQNVTSPNGTTAAGLEVLMATDGLEQLMSRTVEAARRRSEELGRG